MSIEAQRESRDESLIVYVHIYDREYSVPLFILFFALNSSNLLTEFGNLPPTILTRLREAGLICLVNLSSLFDV